jgi:hypothetical protein
VQVSIQFSSSPIFSKCLLHASSMTLPKVIISEVFSNWIATWARSKVSHLPIRTDPLLDTQSVRQSRIPVLLPVFLDHFQYPWLYTGLRRSGHQDGIKCVRIIRNTHVKGNRKEQKEDGRAVSLKCKSRRLAGSKSILGYHAVCKRFSKAIRKP